MMSTDRPHRKARKRGEPEARRDAGPHPVECCRTGIKKPVSRFGGVSRRDSQRLTVIRNAPRNDDGSDQVWPPPAHRCTAQAPPLRCLSRTQVDSRNRRPACTHPPRPRHGNAHLESAVAVHSLRECLSGRNPRGGPLPDCRRCLVLSGVGQNKRYAAKCEELRPVRLAWPWPSWSRSSRAESGRGVVDDWVGDSLSALASEPNGEDFSSRSRALPARCSRYTRQQ